MNSSCPGHSSAALSRRGFLAHAAAGILAASPAVRALAGNPGTTATASPLSPKTPHFTGRANQVIMLYMSGAYSHVDTFDPKPLLARDHEKTIAREGDDSVEVKEAGRFLLRPGWKFSPNVRCGTEVSDLFPNIRDVMDEAALIRSMHADFNNHGEAALQLHTGSGALVMPGIGAWLSHGLGTENPNLPSHVVIAEHLPYAGTQPFDCGFLPRRIAASAWCLGRSRYLIFRRLAPQPCRISNCRRSTGSIAGISSAMALIGSCAAEWNHLAPRAVCRTWLRRRLI